MSSRTPEECVDVARDASADPDARESAIHELKMANECDELAGLVSSDEVDDRYRREALDAIATRQCDTKLEELVEEGSLDPSLQSDAEDLLDGLDVE